MRCLSVSVCLSLCVSVTFVDYVKINKNIFEIFSPSSSHTIQVLPYQTEWRYSHVNPLTGASNAGGVGRNRNSEPISGFTALLVRRHHIDNTWPAATGLVLSVRRRRTTVRPQVVTLIVVVSGGVDSRRDEEMFMTRSLNVTPKTTEQRIWLHAMTNLHFMTYFCRLSVNIVSGVK